jgi:hypothetical protein
VIVLVLVAVVDVRSKALMRSTNEYGDEDEDDHEDGGPARSSLAFTAPRR